MNRLFEKTPPLFLFFCSFFIGITLSRWFFFDPVKLILFYMAFVTLFIIFLFFNLITKEMSIIILCMLFFMTGMVLFKPFESLSEGESTVVGKVYRVTDTSVRLTNVKALEAGIWKSVSGEFYAILPDNSEIEENDYLAVNGMNSKLGNLNFVRAFFSGDYFSYRYLPSPYERTRAFFQSFSNAFIRFLKETVGDENGAIASAVFLGLGLDRNSKDMINRAGISYLFVVSGFHFFLVYFLFSWFISYFKPGHLISFLLNISFLFVFFMTCSTGPSSFRAFLMLLFYELFKFLDYPVSPLSVLGLSGIIILTADPSMSLNAGFQMTYGAVLGILLFSKVMSEKKGYVKFLIPLGSLIFIVPITAVNFGVVPLLSIPVGLLLSLSLIPFTMLCLFITIFLFAIQLQPLAEIVLKGLNPLLSLSRKIIEWLSEFYGTITINSITKVFIVLASVACVFFLILMQKNTGQKGER